MPQRIGFIGLGAMGKPMAINLAKAGFPVTVWNRTRAKSEEVAKQGAKIASSPRELAAASDVVITMIFDDAALEAVTAGKDGALAGLARGSILVEMSTVSPEASERAARAAGERGATMLRSPVIGSVQAAEAGKLIILISGDKSAFESCRGISSAMGQRIHYVGGAEEARYLKLMHNTMVGVSNQMLAEALVFGEKLGLDWGVMCELLLNSFVTSPFVTFKLGMITDMLTKGDYRVAATTRLIAKDLDLALGIAKRQGIPMPVASLTRQFISVLEAKGKGEMDYIVLLLLLEELAGIKRQTGEDRPQEGKICRGG